MTAVTNAQRAGSVMLFMKRFRTTILKGLARLNIVTGLAKGMAFIVEKYTMIRKYIINAISYY